MDRENIFKEKAAILNQFKRYVPYLFDLFENESPLIDYAKKFHEVKRDNIWLQRQGHVKEVIKQKLNKLFGEDYQVELKLNLDGLLVTSIIDHHQILNHPLLISSNIIGNIEKFLQPRKAEAIVVLSSGDTPPNNFFSKGGFQFHGKRVPIFSANERETTTYYLPKRDFNFVEKLKQIGRWSEFNFEEQKFLESECEKIRQIDFSKCADYADQITLIIKNTWPYLFEKKLRSTTPELIYVTQEEVVTNVLVTLLKEDNFINDFFFKSELRQIILDNFRGVVTAWDEKNEKGTHFFWRRHPKKYHYLRLYLVGDKLVPVDSRYKDFSFKFDKETIIDLLIRREIYPNLFTIFTVLHFYAGIKPLTGLGSCVYLNIMKDIWIKIFKQCGYLEESQRCENLAINAITAGLPLFFGRFGEMIEPLYAYDVYYGGGAKKVYLERAFQMKFNELSCLCLPDWYAYFANKYIPKKEHKQLTITCSDLSNEFFNWI